MKNQYFNNIIKTLIIIKVNSRKLALTPRIVIVFQVYKKYPQYFSDFPLHLNIYKLIIYDKFHD